MTEEPDFSDISFNGRDTGDRTTRAIEDQLRLPNYHPKHDQIHSIGWPNGLTPPYRVDVENYSFPDEPAVKALNMLQGVVVCCRQIDSSLVELCDDGATKLRRIQQGADDADIGIHHYTNLAADRGDSVTHLGRLQSQREYISTFKDEAMPRFDEPMGELSDWVNEVHVAADIATQAAKDAWRIDQGDGGLLSRGGWTYDPLPTNEHIERLENSYQNFIMSAYDIELEFVVTEIYNNLETPEETEQELGF